MIFAKLDVCFWRHKKFVRAGAAAAGYFAAALAWLREDESRDGFLEADVIGLLLGLGEREARKLCDRLVEVELFARSDRGYVLLGYAAKNETKDQIATRRAETARRVADSRARRGNGASNGVHADVRNAVGNTLQAPLPRGDVPGSGSLSGSGSDPESGSGVVSTGTVPPADAGHGSRYVRLNDPIDDELRAIAEMATVQDIPGAWAKFTGHFADRWVHVAGKWQHWCVNEAKRERSERDRQRARTPNGGPPLTAEGLDPSSFDASRNRKQRQKQADEDFVAKRIAADRAAGESKT